jgi:peptidoglycan/LPS O-acetylase OafA/YrhL
MNAACVGFNRRRRKELRVNPVRGIVMFIAAAIAFWKGWEIHRGETAILAYGLGAMALVLGLWHLTRERRRSSLPPRPM